MRDAKSGGVLGNGAGGPDRRRAGAARSGQGAVR